jgi:hypothetical protein
MAVRVLPTGTIGIPLNPVPAPEPPPLEVEDDVPTLHLVGRSEQRLAQALFETDAVDEPYSPDTVRALRLLAMDNLVDIIQLREVVQRSMSTPSAAWISARRAAASATWSPCCTAS